MRFRLTLEADARGERGHDARVKRRESGGSALRAVGRRSEEGVGAALEAGVEDSGEPGGGVHGVGGVGGRRRRVGRRRAGAASRERAAVVDVGGAARGDAHGIDWDRGFLRLAFRVGLREPSRQVLARHRNFLNA